MSVSTKYERSDERMSIIGGWGLDGWLFGLGFLGR